MRLPRKLKEIRVSLRAHGERILSCLGHSCPMLKGSTNPIRNISAETCNLISDMSPEATSDEVSFGCIRDIRGVFQKFPTSRVRDPKILRSTSVNGQK